MRADRLLSILFLLQNGKKWVVRDIAEQLEVSERTVARDMEALSAAGVPVYAERGHRGGWMLAEGFRTRLNGLNRQDLGLLILSRSTSSKVFADLGKEREFRDTWSKLMSAATGGRAEPDVLQERIHIDGAGWKESFEAFPLLPALYDAVWNERRVTIRYGLEGETVERELCPLGLVAKGNVWYAVGLVGEDIRTYRVSKMTEVMASDNRFQRPDGFELPAYWRESTMSFRQRLPSYDAQLKVKRSALPRIGQLRFAALKTWTEINEEWLLATADFQTLSYGCEAVLSLGPEAVVIQPAELREAVIAAANSVLDNYKSNEFSQP